MASAAIRTAGLTKSYGGGRGLFDLELQVSAGHAFGLLGSEGSGKTTLVRLLMGMIHPSRGAAYVFGLDCVREAAELKRRVGYMPDGAPDFGSMRGAEVVAFMAGMRGGVHRDRIRELADRVEVDLGLRHRDYSPADRQRLSIVLAFMHEPALLILDEPTQDLDSKAVDALHELIDEAREGGATVLLASRTVAGIERHCDIVGLMRRGRLWKAVQIQDMPVEFEEQARKALPP